MNEEGEGKESGRRVLAERAAFSQTVEALWRRCAALFDERAPLTIVGIGARGAALAARCRGRLALMNGYASREEIELAVVQVDAVDSVDQVDPVDAADRSGADEARGMDREDPGNRGGTAAPGPRRPLRAALALPAEFSGRHVLLIADQIHTGRTAAAAVATILAAGPPRTLRLGCVLDRGLREVPLHPDATGMEVASTPRDRFSVCLRPLDPDDGIFVENTP